MKPRLRKFCDVWLVTYGWRQFMFANWRDAMNAVFSKDHEQLYLHRYPGIAGFL